MTTGLQAGSTDPPGGRCFRVSGWAGVLLLLAGLAIPAAGLPDPASAQEQRRLQPAEQRRLQIVFDPEPAAANQQQRRLPAGAIRAGVPGQFAGRPGNVARHVVGRAARLPHSAAPDNLAGNRAGEPPARKRRSRLVSRFRMGLRYGPPAERFGTRLGR